MDWRRWRTRLRGLYGRHETAWHVAFFVGGFVLDVIAARAGVDSPVIILQQVGYLIVIGGILYLDILREAKPDAMRWPAGVERLWRYRGLAVHFSLGALMNMYSIFFLMSASWFSTIAFALLLLVAVVANELKVVQDRGVDVKVGLFVVCVFCFWSLMVPLAVGRVNAWTFAAAWAGTLAVVIAFFVLLRRRLSWRELRRRLVAPGVGVAGAFLAFYLVGLVPPVPIAAKALGVYHLVERRGSDYVAYHERPAWKFWQTGDQQFVARPGDRIFVFVSVFSPARFADTVFVRWMVQGADGWEESDRIPIHITGGRAGGYRGFTSKQNYRAGDWRVSVETADGREIGRVYFAVTTAEADPDRQFRLDVY
jgi:hypothetical protein